MYCRHCNNYIPWSEENCKKRIYTSALAELPCFEEKPQKDMANTKKCKECGRELPLDAFGNNRQGPLSICRECMSEKRRITHHARKKGETEPAVKKEYAVPEPSPSPVPIIPHPLAGGCI